MSAQAKSPMKHKQAAKSATPQKVLQRRIDVLEADMKGYKAEIVILRSNFDSTKIEQSLIQDMDMVGMFQSTCIKLEEELKSRQNASTHNDSIIDLKKNLAEKEKEVRQKTHEVKQIKEESNVKDSRLSQLVEECQMLKTKLESESSKFPSVKDIRIVKNDYEGKLENLRKELEKAHEKITRHENKLPDILGRSMQSEDYKTLQTKMEVKQNECEEHKLDIMQLTDKIRTLKGNISKQETDSDEVEKDLTHLKQEHVTLKKQLKSSTSHVDALEEKVHMLESAATENAKDAGGDQVEVILRLKTELQQKSVDLDRQHGQFVGEIASMQRMLDSIKKDSATRTIATTLLANKEHDVAELTKAVNKLREEKTSLITDLEIQKRKYEAQIRSLNKEVESAAQELHVQQSKADQMINALKSDIEQKQTLTTSTNIDSVDAKLKIQNELNDVREELAKEKTEHLKTKKKVDDLERLESQKELNDVREELAKEKTAHLKSKKKVDDLESTCHDAFVKLESKDKIVKQLEASHKELVTRKEKTINELRREASIVDPTAGNASEEVRKLREENQHLTTRLSKMAGAQLLDGNPNIADLSDENRATRLGEMFSELYDNEWTDAFEDEEGDRGGEVGVLKYLHDLLIDIYNYCQKLSKDHASSLVSALLSLPNHSPKAENISMAPAKSKQLKDIRKTFAKDITDIVAKCYIKDKSPKISGKSSTEKYIHRCAELCWLMSVQDPPVIIKTDAVDKAGKFDSDIFKVYTKSGKLVDFVVWPPLVLHEKGPLICKGVAQAK